MIGGLAPTAGSVATTGTLAPDTSPPSTPRRKRKKMPGMKKTMGEFKKGMLHSGSKKGPKVKSRKQAIAIGLSQQRKEMMKRV